MEMTRRVMTNVEKPEGTRAPMGQFVRARTYPDASFRDVTAPNADHALHDHLARRVEGTLDPEPSGYEGPVTSCSNARRVDQRVPSARQAHDRQPKAQKFAITGPGWSGTLPAGVTEYKSPTGMVWILGRIYSTGTAQDYKKCTRLQEPGLGSAPVFVRQAPSSRGRHGRRRRST